MQKRKRMRTRLLLILVLSVLCICGMEGKSTQTVHAATKYKLVTLKTSKTKTGSFYMSRSKKKEGGYEIYFYKTKSGKKKKIMTVPSYGRGIICSDDLLIYNGKVYFTMLSKGKNIIYSLDKKGKLKKLTYIRNAAVTGCRGCNGGNGWGDPFGGKVGMWGMYKNKILFWDHLYWDEDAGCVLYVYDTKNNKIVDCGEFAAILQFNPFKYFNYKKFMPNKYNGASVIYSDTGNMINLKTLKIKKMISEDEYLSILYQKGNTCYIAGTDDSADIETIYKYNLSTNKYSKVVTIQDAEIMKCTGNYVEYNCYEDYQGEDNRYHNKTTVYRYMISTKETKIVKVSEEVF